MPRGLAVLRLAAAANHDRAGPGQQHDRPGDAGSDRGVAVYVKRGLDARQRLRPELDGRLGCSVRLSRRHRSKRQCKRGTLGEFGRPGLLDRVNGPGTPGSSRPVAGGCGERRSLGLNDPDVHPIDTAPRLHRAARTGRAVHQRNLIEVRVMRHACDSLRMTRPGAENFVPAPPSPCCPFARAASGSRIARSPLPRAGRRARGPSRAPAAPRPAG
jgi:hypothetical protein